MFQNIRSCLSHKLPGICRVPNVQLSTVKPAAGTSIGKKRFRLPVETNPDKLMKNCCGANYYKDGEDPKLKDDSEYPEWLWELPTVPRKLHEYDPNTKEYWEHAQVVGMQREWKLRSITKNNLMVVSEQIRKKMELKYRRRFRALAKYHYNAGSDVVQHTQREDGWNLHKKDRYALPDDPRPFHPGIDKVNVPNSLSDMLIFRKNLKKIGHFGH